MRIVFLPLAALALIGAADDETGRESAPSDRAPMQAPELRTNEQLNVIELARDRDCRDRITKARETFGKPPLLNREPASPDKPHLIYAVDRRQDGCSVMVMKGDPDDIRPLPLRMEGSPLMPAKGGEE